MLHFLLSLPVLLGCLIFMALSTAIGLAIRSATHRWFVTHQDEAAMAEIKDATSNLFRVVGWLFTLLLSLTFSDVVSELSVTESAIESEAAAILDVHDNLMRFGSEETRSLRDTLIEYTRATIELDRAALAQDNLSEQSTALLRQLEADMLALEATDSTQETVRGWLFTATDLISDNRRVRLKQARERPSLVLLVVVLGYLSTMVYFGVYRAGPLLLGLVTLYTTFVGVVIYIVLAFSDPFQSSTILSMGPFEHVLSFMQTQSASA
jgi:hypothetical protein